MLLSFSLIIAIGGHWAFLQSIAWFGMVVQYSKTASLSVALENTFDGLHPCKLCKLVQDGKKAERKQDIHLGPIKFELCRLTDVEPLLYPPDPVAIRLAPSHFLRLRHERPPTPPPRFA